MNGIVFICFEDKIFFVKNTLLGGPWFRGKWEMLDEGFVVNKKPVSAYGKQRHWLTMAKRKILVLIVLEEMELKLIVFSGIEQRLNTFTSRKSYLK
ncbi:MAG: hypothetical protein KJ941_06250 [Bacteroidetes bacterium]|nr:hypothetical protein [Bacteroidota bacterium]